MEINSDNLRFFRTPAQLNRWLATNHAKKQELWIGFYRKDSGKGGITYDQALDEALCFGWIDGIRKKLDESSFTTRFTPRKPTSIWSNVNIGHIRRLTEEGRMQPAGVEAFRKRDPKKSGVYLFERGAAKLAPEYERRFRANTKGWKYFEAQGAYYKRIAVHFVMSAKQEVTRARRIEQLIECSARESKLPQFTPTPKAVPQAK